MGCCTVLLTRGLAQNARLDMERRFPSVERDLFVCGCNVGRSHRQGPRPSPRRARLGGKRPVNPVLLVVAEAPEARRSGGDGGQARDEAAGDGETDDAVENEREVGGGVRAGGGNAGVSALVLEEADRRGAGSRVRAGAHRFRGEAAGGCVLRADFRRRATAGDPADTDGPSTAAAPVGPSRVLTLPPSVRVSLATGATDMRRSVDGLRALVCSATIRSPGISYWRRTMACRARLGVPGV